MSLKSFIKQTAGSVAEKTTGAVAKTTGAITKTVSDAAETTSNAVTKTAVDLKKKASGTVGDIGMKLARKAIMNDKKTEQANAAVAALEAAGIKSAGKDMSVEDAARLAGTLTGHRFAVEAAITAGKTAKDAVNTAGVLGKRGIFSGKSIFSQVREDGMVTQDMLDAVLCDNKEKLAQAYREAIRAEALGKPLPYLSEEEIEAAFSLRKNIAKSLTRQFFS